METVVDRGTHAVGWCGNVLLIAWRTRLDVTGAEDSGAALRRLAEKHPDGVAVFSHVSPACPVPDGAAREALARIMGQFTLVADASTFDGGGIRQALVRTTVTMLNLMSSKKSPSDVFGDLEQAAQWLTERAAPGRVSCDARTLAGAMRELVAGTPKP